MRIKHYIELLRRMDWWLFATIVALMVISVCFIYSASYRGPGQPMPHYYRMQMIWFGIGLAVYLVAALVDYRVVCQWAPVWYTMAIGALVLVLVAGTKVYGARRWLGWGSFGIQPSEIAKLAVILAVSYYLFHRPPETRRQWRTVAAVLALTGLPLALIVVQPDLGSAMVLVPICLTLMFAAGVRVKHLAVVVAIGLALAPLGWMQLKDYQKARLTVFMNPNKDPLGAGWNLNQSLIAVGSGGFTGKGYLRGTQNLLGYLPRTVAPNDFLFSVIAEETGFVGGLCVVGLYAILFLRVLRIAGEARDRLGSLLATGVVVMLFFHVFINIGMTIGLMPIKGLPLPLLSHGGSFVLATMTALGLVQSVWIYRRVY